MVKFTSILLCFSFTLEASLLKKRPLSSSLQKEPIVKRSNNEPLTKVANFLENSERYEKTREARYEANARKFLTNDFPATWREISGLEPDQIFYILKFAIKFGKKSLKDNKKMAALYTAHDIFHTIGKIVRLLPKSDLTKEISWQMTESDFFEAYCSYKIAKHKCRENDDNKCVNDVFYISRFIVDNYHNKELQKRLKINPSFFEKVENDYNTMRERLEREVPQEIPAVVEVAPQIETVPQAPITKSVHFPEELVTAPQMHQSRAGLVKKNAETKRYLVDDYLLDDSVLSEQKQESFLRAVEASIAEDSQNNKFAAQLLSTIADFFALSRDGGELDKSIRNRAHLILALGLYVEALKVCPEHQSIRAAKNRLLNNQLKSHNVGPIAYRQALAETLDNKPLPLLVQELVARRLEELSTFLLTKPALVAQTIDKLSDYVRERIVTKNLTDSDAQSRRAQEEFLRAWQAH